MTLDEAYMQVRFDHPDPLVRKAFEFARDAHPLIGQVRKYTDTEPYILHPVSVARIVMSVPHTRVMVGAALLHDVKEDVTGRIDDIRAELGEDVAQRVADLPSIREIFGPEVDHLVDELTDVSRREDGTRRVRKAIDLEHTAQASAGGKTIKLADLLHNITNICEKDVGFARTYLPEKAALFEVLREGDATLWNRVREVLIANAHLMPGVAIPEAAEA